MEGPELLRVMGPPINLSNKAFRDMQWIVQEEEKGFTN